MQYARTVHCDKVCSRSSINHQMWILAILILILFQQFHLFKFFTFLHFKGNQARNNMQEVLHRKGSIFKKNHRHLLGINCIPLCSMFFTFPPMTQSLYKNAKLFISFDYSHSGIYVAFIISNIPSWFGVDSFSPSSFFACQQFIFGFTGAISGDTLV